MIAQKVRLKERINVRSPGVPELLGGVTIKLTRRRHTQYEKYPRLVEVANCYYGGS